MQNRLDELFAAARTEPAFYTYTEAEQLVRSFPTGGYSLPKWPLIAGSVLILGGAGFWLMQDSAQINSSPFIDEAPVKIEKQAATYEEKLAESLNNFRLQPLQSVEKAISYDSMEKTAAVSTPGTPPFEEKKLPESEYIVLDNSELKRIGILHKESESISYEFKNGRKRPLCGWSLEYSGIPNHVVTFNDSLREKDIHSGAPFYALFIEYQSPIIYHPGLNKESGIGDKMNLLLTDPCIPERYKETAFAHLKQSLIPVRIEINPGGETHPVTYYFVATEELKAQLPGDIDPKWLKLPDFDWNEYERYREMLFQRERDRETEISANARKVMQSLARKSILLKDRETLKKLGIIYNGRGIKTQLSFNRGGKDVFICRMTFNAGGTSTVSGEETTLDYPNAPRPVFISDSLFKQVYLVTGPEDLQSDQQVAYVSSLADTLVPVIVPIHMTPREKLLHMIDPSVSLRTHMIFWYRRADLEKAGL